VIALVAVLAIIFVAFCCYKRYMRRMGGRGLRLEEIPSGDDEVGAEPLVPLATEKQRIRLPSLSQPQPMPSDPAAVFAET
jgi:hypothetical protein